MLVLLHYDAVNNPVANSSTNRNKDFSIYLERHPYEEFTDGDLAAVSIKSLISILVYIIFFKYFKARALLESEVNAVKKTMGHGDISLDVYSKVWDECYSQVLFLPSKNRFTRANAASKKDRIESAEQKLEVNFHLIHNVHIFFSSSSIEI
jgi:pre-mRNA-splicing factor CDC5/CEF1